MPAVVPKGLPLVVTPDAGFLKQMNDDIKVNVNVCYQCRKCSAGCPMSYAMDYTPAQLIHAIRLGLKDIVLNSKTMWMCSSCQTCTTRCPQEVDIAKVMDTVKIMAVAEGVKPPVSRVHKFNRASLRNIKWFGRMYELGLIGDLKMRTFEFFKDMGLGIKMFMHGKLKIIPPISPGRTLTTMGIFSRTYKKEMEKSK
ncbi:MAG: 4Fe-4S dicluster domain-containing protein [Planctomycetes bacterium]|nr:4Fe-4S dicluster domain-containing protein [Planctomycetota bacterium]